MAVTRVSPAPTGRIVPYVPQPWDENFGHGSESDSEPFATVRDGYVWKMADPPCSDPETVHHDAALVHHDEVRHVFAVVSGTWSVAEHDAGGEHYAAQSGSFGFETDLGEGWTPPSPSPSPDYVAFADADGSSVRYSPVAYSTGTSYVNWVVSLPAVQVADPARSPFYCAFRDAGSGFLEGPGSSASGSGSVQSTGASATVSVSLEERVVAPAWDEVESDSWDEAVSPAPLRKISYCGDYDSCFSSPPPGSGLSPSSLRGEAVAYLASGYRRIGSLAGGAIWLDGSGRIASAPGLLGCGIGDAPSLDMFRLALLGYLYTMRAPAAPGIPCSASPAAYMVGGTVSDSVGNYAEVAIPPDRSPESGGRYRVAASFAEVEGRGWLFPDDSDDSDDADSLGTCMAAFMASASEPQPVPGPAPGPPGRPPLDFTGVSMLFSGRPTTDVAAMTRGWAVGASFAVDPSACTAFRYVAAAGCSYRTFDRAVASSLYDSFLENHKGYDYIYDSSTDDVTINASAGDAFMAYWAPSGAVAVENPWRTVRVIARPDGPELLDVGRTQAQGDAPNSDAWLDALVCGRYLGQPANTRYARDKPPYYWEPVAVPDEAMRRFSVPYVGGAADARTAELPAVPPSGSPLFGVPAASPDDVAVQLVFTAAVVLDETVVGDHVSVAADVGAPWDPDMPPGYEYEDSGLFRRRRRWVVSGMVPGYGRWTRPAGAAEGSFDAPSNTITDSPSDVAQLVETAVLGAIGVDPSNLLRGTAGYSYEPVCEEVGCRIKFMQPDHVPTGPYDVPDYSPDGEYPAVREVVSGSAVVEALLTVDIQLDAGSLVESGYCA